MPIARGESSIERSLLRDDVFLRLRDAIVAGRLAPGEQLRDVELAARLGVSRTPVREALLRLADCGLVVSRPGRATYVTELVAEAVADARDVVAGMHAVAVHKAVPLMTAADIEEMREAGERFKQAMLSGDLAAAVAADDQLHGVPVRVAANAALAAVLEQHTPLLRRAERLQFFGHGPDESVAMHDQLIAHCAAGAARKAAAVAFDTWVALDVGRPSVPEPRGPVDPGPSTLAAARRAD